MDLKNTKITNLTEYTFLSRDMITKYSQLKITLNSSTLVTLNKFKIFETEYFIKYSKCGAAFQALEKMLLIRPSKTWDDLSKELVSLLKFWFNKLQHQMIKHNTVWWNFLLKLLNFVKELRTKSPLLNYKLVEGLGEDFLQLSTNNNLDLNQRRATLQCFNACCAELPKQSRLALREMFEEYFTKLAHEMPSWGDFRLQFNTMETLLRWLLRRNERTFREEVAALWFPRDLYSRMAVKIFLERDWKNFFKDARDFLNAQNENNSSIISLICKKLNIGKTEAITAKDKKHWIDFNIANNCISLMLELKLLEVLKIANSVFDALVIEEDNTRSVKLIRNGAFIQIDIIVMEPLNRSSEKINNEREISIYMNAINAEKVNESLKKIFGNKYEASFVEEGKHQCSPNTAGECSQIENSEDSRQFAINTRRGKQSRVAAATLNRQSNAWKSPSTTSTTSLLLLKEKLSEYPGCVGANDEEYGGICAKPLLPRVAEESENEDDILCVLTPRNKPRCNAVFSHKINVRDSVDKTTASKPSTISLVLATTIDSYEANAPHDTLDGFPEDLELNTLNYMAYRQQNKSESTSDLQSEVIENTPFVRPILDARENVQVCDKNYKTHYELIEADVIQCVNDLVDQVCADYEMNSHLMNEKEFTNKLLIEAGLPITTQSEHRSTDTQKAKKKTAKPIEITFPKTKVNKRKGQRRQKRPEPEAATKLSIAYETDVNLKSPNINIKGAMTRRRRKLYSPKDNLTFQGPVDPETGVEQTRTPTTSKTPYREIQEMRATHRESTKRKSIPKKVVLSPRSKRLNDDFDKLLQTDCNDESLKKSNNTKVISVYNFTDSDDSDFKDNGNLTKPSLPLRKSNASVNLMEKKSRKRKQKRINVVQDTLIDERMRNATADLNTSFTIEEPIETCANVEVPVIVVEPIIKDENISTKKSRIVKTRETKKNTKSRKGPKKTNKQPTTKVMNMSRDRDESISPGLKCEFQEAEKKPDDSLTDLDKIHIIEKADKETSFERRDCVYETIETKAIIEHVPLVRAPIELGQSSRGQPNTLTQSIQNVMPEAPHNEICQNKISEDECAQRFLRVSVERMSEKDIKEWLSPRAKSSLSGTSKPSPKPENDARPPVGDKSHLFSPRCEILAKNKYRKICNSLILPFKNNKKSKDHRPELKRVEPDVDYTEKDKCRNSSSIRAVSLKTRKTPKAFNNRVLKTPDSKENLIKDIPIKRRAEKLRSISSSDSDKRRITRRALERPISDDDSSSREEESESSMKECSNAETIHNWLDRSQHELETEEFDGVRVNVFGDIFKEVQKKIDFDLAKIKNNARNSLEHIQRGVVKQIEEARLRRRALYTESAREIFSDIGKILDAKFTELEAKSQRVDDQVLEKVSRDSTQMLSEIATIQLDLVSYLDAERTNM
ncbi:unnamed protein product [Pieris macdunnoughi]|uniref:Uncharacterized protein n=1 Tax=Pieris macdunnoughi TaxID=345717 RepID=A0A821SN36_9NEOP|nr:unnamed protein product [Pieris macdunnoughi]